MSRMVSMKRCLIAFAVLLTAALWSLPGPGAEPSGVPQDTLVRRVEEIRGLRFKRPVPWLEVSHSEMKKLLEEQVDKEYETEDWPRLETTLKAFGLIPKRSSLRDTLLILLEEQAVGLYDPHKKRMVVGEPGGGGDVDDLLSSLNIPGFSLRDLVLVHELDHALTDQHFDLRSLPIEEKFHDDKQGAAMAVVEGDATWVMLQYMYELLGIPREQQDQYGQMLGPGMVGQDLMSVAIPLYLRENLMSYYIQGLGLVQMAYDKGGVKAVNDLYENPPASMEQVLHPEKYFRGMDPPKRFFLKLPPAWVDMGWTEYTSGVWGELNVKIVLRGWGVSEEKARAAAEGWGGDAYITAKGDNGALAWIWVTQWDTAKDAEEFVAVLGDHKDRKVTHTGTQVTVVQGRPEPAPPIKTVKTFQ
jgi:hypothetical protein